MKGRLDSGPPKGEVVVGDLCSTRVAFAERGIPPQGGGVLALRRSTQAPTKERD